MPPVSPTGQPLPPNPVAPNGLPPSPVPPQPGVPLPNQFGAAPQGPAPMPGTKVNSHMTWAVLVTVLCSQLFGAVAIYYAAKASGFSKSGDIVSAQQASKKAKTWCIVAMAVGIPLSVLYIATGAFGGN